ncbi:hypothetical protein BJX70DRAFT_79238 [Aspergillus crustosus]
MENDTAYLSDSDGEECMTPTGTHTSIPSPSLNQLDPNDSAPPSYASTRATVGVCPQKNKTFIIRDPKTDLVVALKDGVLGLHPDEKERTNTGIPHHGRGSHWHCVENDDLWLGFRSAVSGCYIGHNNEKNNNWRFIAEVKRHAGWEYFCAREHPEGGHVLLVKHNSGFRAMKAGGRNKRELVVCDRGESGTAWDFIQVFYSG